jgi:cell division transport system permease protein
MRGFFYCLKEGLKGFQRVKLASIWSILTFAISVLLIGSFLLLSLNLQRFVRSIKDRLEFEVYIENSLAESQIQELQQRIHEISGVKTVEYISRQDALEVFKKEFGQGILDVLEDNPLPASFRIQARDEFQQADGAKKIVQSLAALKGVDEVVYREDVMLLLDRYLRWMVLILLGGGILVCLSSIFFVYNTIRLIIFSRREIIEAMKLVGATPWFIRLPYLFEGFLQALFGTVFACGILLVVSDFLSRQVLNFQFISFEYWLIILGGGLLVGLIGSTIAIKRFLKY